MRLLLLIALHAVAFAAADAAHAAYVRYDIVFADRFGETIGGGFYTYDDNVVEDVYWANDGPYAGLCDGPNNFGCDFIGSWRPILDFQAEILGLDVLSVGNDGYMWTEGGATYHGRYMIGSVTPGAWFIGDIYFGELQMMMNLPPLGASAAVGDFFLAAITLPNGGYINGTASFTKVIPIPAAAWLFLSGFGAAAVAGRNRRRQRRPES